MEEEDFEFVEDDVKIGEISKKRQKDIAKNAQRLLYLPGKIELVFLNIPGCGTIRDWQLKGYCILNGSSPIEQLVTPGFYSETDLKIKDNLPNLTDLLIKLGYNTGTLETKQNITLQDEIISYIDGDIADVTKYTRSWKSVTSAESHPPTITLAPFLLCI